MRNSNLSPDEQEQLAFLCDKFALEPDYLLVDFDESCDMQGFTGFLYPKDEDYLAKFRELFDKNHFVRAFFSDQPKVPKIIHQIWLGTKEIEPLHEEYRKHWQELHPDWEYRLWRDEDIEGWDFGTRDLFEESDSFSEKTDMLRVEILKKYGGLYIDIDYDCYKPFDIFTHLYDFFGTMAIGPLAYLQAPKVIPAPLGPCNSLIGTRPGHPILDKYLQKVREIWNEERFFELSFMEKLLGVTLKQKRSLMRTYVSFAQVLHDEMGKSEETDILFPPSYFHPVDTWWHLRFILPQWWKQWLKFRLFKGGFFYRYPFNQPREHSFSHHHSAATWLKNTPEKKSKGVARK